MPSDWDEDEEYIFDDSYDSDDDNDDDEDDIGNEYDEIDPAELDDLNEENANNNQNNDNVEAEDVVEEEENENDEAEQQPLVEDVDDEDEPDVVPDDSTVGTNEQQGRQRTQTERLTYSRLGETHQQTAVDGSKKIKKNASFGDTEAKKLEQCHNIIVDDTSDIKTLEYKQDMASVIGKLITDINGGVMRRRLDFVQVFAQQYLLDKGIKKFGKKGVDASYKEMEQLHKRTCFTPLDVSQMTKEEKRKAQLALMFLTEKRDKSIKGRMVYNLSLIHI